MSLFALAPVRGALYPLGYTGPTGAEISRLVQPYGCTGFSWEPRRGTCAHWHNGIDIGNRRCGDVIQAVAAGVVKVDGIPSWSLGATMVRLDHGVIEGYHYRTDYYHLKSEGVSVGQHVAAGQAIGRMGSTGHSTACHLHFGVKRRKVGSSSWVNVNPWTRIPHR
jgi:murein DD-endopeptidase MepM/ murein hydrolase activator NlpD